MKTSHRPAYVVRGGSETENLTEEPVVIEDFFDRPGCQSAHSPCPSLPDPGAKTSREILN